ncbi:MAG: hypothetical protein H0V23_06075 [Nocardioidaceae bacterium]|nr:hypothetical protein [Nocardioidaceae bacterium]
MAELPTGTVTLLFSDIQGSTVATLADAFVALGDFDPSAVPAAANPGDP